MATKQSLIGKIIQVLPSNLQETSEQCLGNDGQRWANVHLALVCYQPQVRINGTFLLDCPWPFESSTLNQLQSFVGGAGVMGVFIDH